MFSFHKPKVYRSPTGCCICKAKSSSSRFTDSKKYEEDFIECFQLEERRNGEICNACVLLVKRWKKLPTGSNRNWRHVVDARAGPGIKSLTKFKSKNKKKPKDSIDKIEKILKKKHVYLKPDRYREQSPAMSDDLTEEYLAGAGSKGSSRSGSPAGSDDAPVTDKRLNPTAMEADDVAVHGWIDLTYFKRESICCGTIFKGPYGEVIVDPSLIKPCAGCASRRMRESLRRTSATLSPSPCSASASPAHSVDTSDKESTTKPLGKTFSDSSSDSGYDESSNPCETKAKKRVDAGDARVDIANDETNRNVAKRPETEEIRLKNETLTIATLNKQVEKLVCAPLATLSVTQSVGNGQTVSRQMANNPLIDFAIHAAARQSIAN